MATKPSGGPGVGSGSSNSNRIGLDEWREFFRGANTNIFNIIEHSIMVAASDCSQEFRLRRDRIAELLYTSKLSRCTGCDRVELAVAEEDEDINMFGAGGLVGFMKDDFMDDGAGDDDDRSEFFDDAGITGSKESKANSVRDDQGEGDVNVINQQHTSKYTYDAAEAVTNEIEEEDQIIGEVLRIKDVLLKYQHESEAVLFDCLRKLQMMSLNVDMLKSTEIGKVVNGLRRHKSREICHFARVLVGDWKVLVDQWYSCAEEMTNEGTPDSVNPSSLDQEEEEEEEEGLPSPPLDLGAFCTQNMELSQFFDGMDDIGNPRNCGEFNKNRAGGRKPPVTKPQNVVPKRQEEQPPRRRENVVPPRENRNPQQMRKQENVPRPVPRSSNAESGPGRPVKPNVERKVGNEARIQQQKATKPVIQRRPAPQSEQKLRSYGEDDVKMKLEASKRRLQELYQEAEKAKRQRTIQVMELHDLPKQAKQGLSNQKNGQGRFGNFNRGWGNGRK